MQISRQCVKFNPTYQKDMDQVTMKKMNERLGKIKQTFEGPVMSKSRYVMPTDF